MIKLAAIFLLKCIVFTSIFTIVFFQYFPASSSNSNHSMESTNQQQDSYNEQLKKSKLLLEENEALLNQSKILIKQQEDNLKREAAILLAQEKKLGINH